MGWARAALAGTLLWVLVLGASPSGAQPVAPLGDQFQVNTLTSGYQSLPVIVHRPNDVFVVFWGSTHDPEGSRVRHRRYNSLGSPIGNDSPLNPDLAAGQSSPQAEWTIDNRFLVVWVDDNGEQPGRSIRGRLYNDTFGPVGSEFEVSPSPGSDYSREPSLALADTGEFVVGWSRRLTTEGELDYDVLVRRFEYGGAPITEAVQVNTIDAGFQTDPVVRFQPTGEFIVVWSSVGSLGNDSSGYSIQLRRFDSDGSPIGTETQVNTYTTVDQRHPEVGMLSDGSFVVAWRDYEATGDLFGVRARRFDDQAMAIGAEFQANTYTTGSQGNPSIAVAEGDEFVVAWQSNVGYEWRIGGRAYDADGSPIGDEFRVDTLDTGSLVFAPKVSFDSDSGFVVAWHGYGSAGTDTAGTSVQARRFRLPAIFEDGFESGDLSAWSSEQP